MKKFTMAAAIVCAAVASQAAQFNWSTDDKAFSILATTINAGLESKIYNAATTGNANTMYNQMDTFGATWAYEMVLTDLTAGGSKTFSGNLGEDQFASRGVNIDFDDAFVVAGNQYQYDITFTGKLTDGQDVAFDLTSDVITDTFKAAAQGDITFSSAGPSKWTAVGGGDVPEPTSGLLLLLGMAGLALRRKQA